MPRTDLAFTGTIGHRFYDEGKKVLTLQFRDDRLVKTVVDTTCTITVATIESALNSLQASPALAIAASGSLIADIVPTNTRMFTIKHLWSRAHQWLEIIFPASINDAQLLKPGTTVQVFQVDPAGTCQAPGPLDGSAGGSAGGSVG
jgi:hypothetical protein